MKRRRIAAIVAAVALPLGAAGLAGASVSPAEDEDLRDQVQQVFVDYLATIDPIGPEFYAQQCAYLDYDLWHCTAIDEGVVSAFVEPRPVGDRSLFLSQPTHYPAGTGVALPL